jgi:serine/threonine protein kinase
VSKGCGVKTFDLSSYSLKEPLPVGGMTQAFLATRNDAERVVVKRLHASYASNPTLRARWLAQVARAAAFSHPASMRVLDYGEAGEDAYMVLEHIEGVGLMTVVRSLRASDERLSIDASIHIARALLEVLAEGHSQNPVFLHHDVSTSAVRISVDGSVRIGEGATWGSFAAPEAIRERFERGNAVYQSPEQVNGLEPDPRSELFSVGVVLYELLAAQRPFNGGNQLGVAMAIADGRRKKLREVAPAVPQALCNVVERLLAPKAEDRFPTAASALAVLAAFGSPDVRAELAALVPRFRANEAPGSTRPKTSAPPAVAQSAALNEPRTAVDWARPAERSEPPQPETRIPLEHRGGEPRTQLLHGGSIREAVSALRNESVAPSAEPRTQLQVPVMRPGAVQAQNAAPTGEPKTRMQGSFEPPFRKNASSQAAHPAPSEPPAPPSRPSPVVFGGAASEPPRAPREPALVSPPPAVLAPPALAPEPSFAAQGRPEPVAPPLVALPGLVESKASRTPSPTPPPLLSNVPLAAPPQPLTPVPPPIIPVASPGHGATSLPAAQPAAGPAPAVPVVSDGKTAFLDRNALRKDVAPNPPVESARTAPPAPALVSPPQSAPSLPQERALPELVPAMQGLGSSTPSAPDRGWKDPSQTLFRAKTYAKDPTRREQARIPTPVLVALAVVFGFALIAGGYFLIRLFS